LAEQQDEIYGTYNLYGNQARVCTKFPDQVRLPVLLYRWGKPRAVLSVQVPLYVGLLNGLCYFLCALVKFPGQSGWRLFSAMSRVVN